jgi:hemerythrin-like domain-containing protein
MQTTDILKAEHAGVLMVLDQLERAVAAAERGGEMPRDVFCDIQEFFSVFVDRCHHTKEETALFPPLAAHGLATLVHRLEQDHEIGRAFATVYAEAVQAYTPGRASSGGRLASAARRYAEFLREHIELETLDLLPAIQQQLAAQDGELAEAFERIETERIGAGTHERLHAMIEGLAARIEPYAPALPVMR